MKPERDKIIRRLKVIVGQARALQEMLEKNAYCIDVITQSSAIKQALSAVEDVIIENHLKSCTISQMKKGKENLAIKEIMKVYGLKRK